MALGKCVNIMGKCSKALNKKVQEKDKANFFCEECGKPLVECGGTPPPPPPPPPPSLIKYIVIVVAALAILGGGGYGIYTQCVGKKPTEVDTVKKDTVKVIIAENELTLNAGASEKLTASVDTLKDKLVWSVDNEEIATVSADSEVSGKKAGEVTVTANINVNDTNIVVVPATCKVTVNEDETLQEGPKPVTVFGGRAKYDKNLKEITFIGTVTMSLHTEDDETITLRKGDKIVGAKVQNGYLIQGEVVYSNGERRLLTGLRNRM